MYLSSTTIQHESLQCIEQTPRFSLLVSFLLFFFLMSCQGEPRWVSHLSIDLSALSQ